MAWRSSGSDNDDLVNNLTKYRVISNPAVEAAFRIVDRQYFVPQNHLELAHSDQPLKEENIHISAPHIYGTIVESLDLEAGSSQTFLNIGSGTGYLSCIVSQVLGPDACSFGVEIFPDVIEHCKQSLTRWQDARQKSACDEICISQPTMEFVCGNGLEIDATKGECQFGFDRIYVGAAVQRSYLNKFAELLRPGGILVAPVEDDLVKVTRIGAKIPIPNDEDHSMAEIPRAPRSVQARGPSLSEDFSMQVISGVRFAPLLRTPSVTTVIPSKVWEPSVHQCYPKSFRESIKEILLCSHAPVDQPPKIVVTSNHVNLASTLPKDIWMKVLSYTHRSWFEQQFKVDESMLRNRLSQEQQAAQKAKEACTEAERRLKLAERERDGYKFLAMRWQIRLRSILNEANKQNNGNDSTARTASNIRDDDPLLLMDDLTEAAASLFQNDSFFLRMTSINVGRRHHAFDSDESSDAEGDEDDGNLHNDEAEEMNMDAESDDDNHNEMHDMASDEDDSEEFTIAASPDTSELSFYRHVSETLESQSFFT